MDILNLSGKWHCTSENGDVDRDVTLPGSSCENGIGREAKYYDEYCREALRAPVERFEYIGKLYYEREIEVPEEFEGRDLCIFLERVNIASKLWFDDILVGRGVIGLSTPHVYRLTDRVNGKGKPLFTKFAGKHRIRLEIDNSNILNMGDMASGYSVDTQGYWNGVIGRMELQARPVDHIDSVQAFPEGSILKVSTVTVSDRHVPMETVPARLEYTLTAPSGAVVCAVQSIELFSKKQRNRFELGIAEIISEKANHWNEFNTGLCTLTVKLVPENVGEGCGKETADEYTVRFGIRKLYVKDKSFMIDSRPLSLRGTINCAQYPLTGYPPMDEETWEKHFRTLKKYGMNHVRFHAWCPPEAAFEAADRLGIYLGVEMPLWLNRDVTPMELGDDEWHRLYYRDEALRISETYGNHPSFVFFSNGNENLGDYALLDTITEEMKAHDDRRLYTMSSNFDHPLSASEDYLCAFEILHNKARIQFLHDEVAESTTVNYDEMREKVPVPFTSFEVGQYCIYPDVDICEKYTGAMLPVNFDVIRKSMKQHGVYERLSEYIKASGDLAAKLYKEDIEAVLRTKGMGGFQLLSLTDYTGQSTATVGILDVMFESKSVIEPEKWREFCSEVVPLLWAKRQFASDEHLTGFISLYDSGLSEIKSPVYNVTLENVTEGKEIFTVEYPATGDKTPIDIPLDMVGRNSLIKVRISVKGDRTYTNSWRIFVYKKDTNIRKTIPESRIVRDCEAYERALKEGGRFLLTPEFFGKEKTVKNSFIPVFWSPVHFPSEAPVGFIIDNDSAVLNSFPTEKYADYQWKKPIENSYSVRIKDIEKPVKPVVETVPNFSDNEPKSPLFVMKDGNAEFVYFGFDLSPNDPAGIALVDSVLGYLEK